MNYSFAFINKNDFMIFSKNVLKTMSFTQLTGKNPIRCSCCYNYYVPDETKMMKYKSKSHYSQNMLGVHCEKCMEHFDCTLYPCNYYLGDFSKN